MARHPEATGTAPTMMPDDVLAAAYRPRGHRHRWDVPPTPAMMEDGDFRPRCGRCRAFQDPTKSRRGKSSSRLGKDQERRIERTEAA